MPKNPNYKKNSRVDLMYKKYPSGYPTYEELRADLATINSSIMNEEANISLNNNYDSYTTASRKLDETKGIPKKYNKKRLYGVVVGNSQELGKNVYVDVPLSNINIIKDDLIFLESKDLKLSDYQELIFFPLNNPMQYAPQQGAICVVEIPENYPNHVDTNHEDAIFIDLYRKDILAPAGANRPQAKVIPGSLQDQLLNIATSMVSGGAAAGYGGGGASVAPYDDSLEPDKPETFIQTDSYIICGPKVSIDEKRSFIIIIGGLYTDGNTADFKFMYDNTPRAIRNNLWCVFVNHDAKPADQLIEYCNNLAFSTGYFGSGGKKATPEEVFSSRLIAGFSAGGTVVVDAIKPTNDAYFRFIGLIDPWITDIEDYSEAKAKNTKFVFNKGNIAKNDNKEKVYAAFNLLMQKMGRGGCPEGSHEEVPTLGHYKIPSYFFKKYITDILGEDKDKPVSAKGVSGIPAANVPSDGVFKYDPSFMRGVTNRPAEVPLLTKAREESTTHGNLPNIFPGGWFYLNAKEYSGEHILNTNHSVDKIVFGRWVRTGFGDDSAVFLYENALYSAIHMFTAINAFLSDLERRTNTKITKPFIKESWRTDQDQKDQQTNPAAAPVGRSNHQAGLAIDMWYMNLFLRGRNWLPEKRPSTFIPPGKAHKDNLWLEPGGPVFDWLSTNAWKYGWRRTVGSEIWHIEYRDQWVNVPWTKFSNEEVHKEDAGPGPKHGFILQHTKNQPKK